MLNKLSRVGALVAVMGLAASLAFAGAPQKPKPAPTCPACHMKLSTKKDKVHTVAVKINGKTYYCCANCGMNHKPKK